MPVGRRVYLDTGVLISAFRGEQPLANRALKILDDPDVCFVVSEYLELKVLLKPVFHGNVNEEQFMREVINASESIESTSDIRSNAYELACNYGLAAMDALYVSAAIAGEVDEIVTSEKDTKPICRVREVTVSSLHDWD